MMALVVPGVGGREVTRAKNDMSVLIRGQGRVPEWPMPRRIELLSVGMGVVATMRVMGRDGGIFVGYLELKVWWCVGW